MRKVVPIGGIHKSATSLLAEIMSDPDLDKVAVFVKTKDGRLKASHFEMLDEDMAIVSIVADQMCRDTLFSGE